MQNWIKVTLGILGTVMLGAIGSGLWERFLSDFFDSVVNWSIRLVDSVFKSYKDGIYENASLGFHESHSMTLLSLIFVLLPLGYIHVLSKHPENNSSLGGIDRRVKNFVRSNNGYWFIYVMTITVMIFCLFSISRVSYTNRIVTYSLRSVEIVKPYVDPKEHDELLSQFYQVRNSKDYEDFHSRILEIADKNALKLPKANPL